MDGLEQALNKEAGDWLPAYKLGYLFRSSHTVVCGCPEPTTALKLSSSAGRFA